jgi:hypothetical protein
MGSYLKAADQGSVADLVPEAAGIMPELKNSNSCVNRKPI